MYLWPFTLPVYAGFGVRNFVQAGDFEAISTSPLALVHVIPKGKNHLQELPQTLASDEFFGCQKNGLKGEKRRISYYTVAVFNMLWPMTLNTLNTICTTNAAALSVYCPS